MKEGNENQELDHQLEVAMIFHKFSQFKKLHMNTSEEIYCANPKTVTTRIISGMLLCCEEKAKQMQDEKTTSCNGN